MPSNRVALVVGASRGIGRACARHLAAAGLDVAVAARTLREGEAPAGLPGSLDAVSKDVEKAGRRALACQLDLLDLPSCARAVAATLEAFGRIDVLVNSGIYYGHAGMRLFADTPIEEYEKAFTANVVAPLFLVQQVLPTMRQTGGGVVINITSGAGQNETRALPGAGGWPLTYSVTKAAFNRSTAGLAKELRAERIAVVNLEPGVVATERMTLLTSRQGIDTAAGVPVDVPGAVCAYVASHPTPMAFSGRTVDAPQFSVWAALVDGSSLPYPYGPSAWGAPPPLPIAGAATGIGGGVPSPPKD
ncbi:MAG TPA: SDR family NAD(P)-dependent oxidoreductase [Acidimicrobiales bacterium]|nr:SDR family NAD(P)-dependent oxidoreductase [Acidimicrobiales bacterium]